MFVLCTIFSKTGLTQKLDRSPFYFGRYSFVVVVVCLFVFVTYTTVDVLSQTILIDEKTNVSWIQLGTAGSALVVELAMVGKMTLH